MGEVALQSLDVGNGLEDDVELADVLLALDGGHQLLEPPVRVGRGLSRHSVLFHHPPGGGLRGVVLVQFQHFHAHVQLGCARIDDSNGNKFVTTRTSSRGGWLALQRARKTSGAARHRSSMILRAAFYVSY